MQESVGLWIGSILVITVVLALIGIKVKRKWFGILIENTGRISLSRLQLTLWTILLVSAFLIAAITSDPMTVNIYLAPEVWALLGISVGSGAGSVIIKSNKAAKTADLTRYPIKNNQSDPIKEDRLGVLAKTDHPTIWDIFKGEELADKDHVDIGKVQMFFFTLAIIGGYCAALFSTDLTVMPAQLGLGEKENYDLYFPLLSDGMVTLLGISHAGYLTIKAAPKTLTA